MNLIVAVADNLGIGCNGDLLYKIKQDHVHFRTTTTGKTVVMGRKTYVSLPGSRALANRRNIVLSTDMNFMPDDAEVCRDLDELFELVKDIPTDEVFVIGGEQIYRALMSKCDKLYITKIYDSPKADTFFPDFTQDKNFELAECSERFYDGDLEFEFCVYKKI